MNTMNTSQFDVDDDLVALIWQLAKPKPFEQLTFSQALRRILAGPVSEQIAPAQELAPDAESPSEKQELLADRLLAELSNMSDEEFAQAMKEVGPQAPLGVARTGKAARRKPKGRHG